VVIAEAAAVEARGRISAQDVGLWNDEQADAFARIVQFIKDQGALAAIQLAHAGRKARVPGAIAPSELPFADMPVPKAMSKAEIAALVSAFQRAAVRARRAGFDIIEIHAAHGYLLHEFLSPLSNQRTDEYGGAFDNRIRSLLEVVRAVRAFWPDNLPLFVRISATDWVDGGWDLGQSIELSRRMASLGVDLVDVSSGGLSPDQQLQPRPGYQVPFAERIKREAKVMTGAVGLIIESQQAEAIINEGRADAVLIARQALRDPYWPIRAARELGQEIVIPFQYERAW
jgi:2,4-dienoyl-CoA reductase-like NADH-dependent reductase (Old Yellow Enzyme family)